MTKPSDYYGDFPWTRDKGKHLHKLRTFEEQIEYHLWLLESLKRNHQYACYRVCARDVMLKLNKLLDLYESHEGPVTKTSNAAEEYVPNYKEHHETTP